MSIQETEEKILLTKEEIELRRKWYSNIVVAFNITNYSRGRETAFLNVFYNYQGNVRYLNMGIVDIFLRYLGLKDKNSDPYNFFTPKRNYSIYCSLAKIDWAKCDVKAFSYSSKIRKEQQELFKENAEDYFTNFTFAMDFDGDLDNGKHLEISQEEAVERARKDLLRVKKLFDDYKIAYWCQFSGSRGMHLFAEIPLNISFNQKLDLSNILVKELADTLDLHTCDRASYNLRKVFKLCYTLNTKHGKTFVVLPLDDYMLNNFKLDYVTPEYVMKNIHLKNRGLLMRNGANINNTSNFINLLEALEIKITEKSDMRNI